jgi:hypothetical protein
MNVEIINRNTVSTNSSSSCFNRVSRKMKSAVCLSADLSIFFLAGKIDRFEICTVDISTNSRFVFMQQIVDLVQNSYVDSPLGDLNPLSSPRIEKLIIPSLVALAKTQN